MASIRFFKLFDMLARMGYKKTDLKTEIGLSSTTIANAASLFLKVSNSSIPEIDSGT